MSKDFDSRFVIAEDKRGPLYIENETQLRFRRIPEGTYPLGLSDEEENQIVQLGYEGPIEGFEPFRGAREVSIGSFVITETPLTNQQIKSLVPSYSGYGEDCEAELVKPKDAEKIASRGYDLPTADEMETAWRGTTKRQLFPFGNKLPSERLLEKWMEWDLSSPITLPANKIGLVGLFCGGWTKSSFKFPAHAKVPKKKPIRSVKCSASGWWPWQGDEWLYCVNAIRSSALELEDGECPVWLVVRES